MDFGRTGPSPLSGVLPRETSRHAETTGATAASQAISPEDARRIAEARLLEAFEKILASAGARASSSSSSTALAATDAMPAAPQAVHALLATFNGTEGLDLSSLDSPTLHLVAQLPTDAWKALKDFATASGGHEIACATLSLPRGVADSAPLMSSLFEGLRQLDRLQDVFIVPRLDAGVPATGGAAFELDLSRLQPEDIEKIMIDAGIPSDSSTPEVRIQVTLPKGVDLPASAIADCEFETVVSHVATDAGDTAAQPAPDTKAGPGLNKDMLARHNEIAKEWQAVARPDGPPKYAQQPVGSAAAAATLLSKQREMAYLAELEGVLARQLASPSPVGSTTAREIAEELVAGIDDDSLDLSNIDTETIKLVLQCPLAWKVLNAIASERQSAIRHDSLREPERGTVTVWLPLTPSMAGSAELMNGLCKSMSQLDQLKMVAIVPKLPSGHIAGPVPETVNFALSLKDLPGSVGSLVLTDGLGHFHENVKVQVTLSEGVYLYSPSFDGEVHHFNSTTEKTRTSPAWVPTVNPDAADTKAAGMGTGIEPIPVAAGDAAGINTSQGHAESDRL